MLERKPTEADPCLTASSAYSIWWRRPCGDQVEMSLSYWFRNYRSKWNDSRRRRRRVIIHKLMKQRRKSGSARSPG